MTENVNPADLEPGDRVVVDEQGSGFVGEVVQIESEGGRFCVEVKREDGTRVACWQRAGRAFHRIGDGGETADEPVHADHGDGFEAHEYADEKAARINLDALRADIKHDNLAAAQVDARDLLDALTPDGDDAPTDD